MIDNQTNSFIPAEPHPTHFEGKPIVATYPYRLWNGLTIYEVCRLDPKDFRPLHINDDGRWTWGLPEKVRTIYNLPEVLNAPMEGIIYIVEGEKDAENHYCPVKSPVTARS